MLYLKGHLFVFELEGGALPAAGAVWTMRDFVGAVAGGSGRAGGTMPYSFTTQEMPRPFTAVGGQVRFSFEVENRTVASTAEQLAAVHTVPDPYYVTSAFEATTT